MTPHSQQEYIITKKELDNIQDAIGLSADCEISHTICQEAIDRARNRPTPTPAAPAHVVLRAIVERYLKNYILDFEDGIVAIYRNQESKQMQVKIPLHPEYTDYTDILTRAIDDVIAALSATTRNQALEEIENYCQAERQNTRTANYPSKDYERGMITMSNRIHSFAEYLRSTPSTQAQQHERGDQR